MVIPAEELTDPFVQRFRGMFSGVMRWEQLDEVWQTVKQQIDDEWYVYAVGETPPTETSKGEDVLRFVDEVDALLRKEHEEDYCGIVYVDDMQQPGFIKIFDPNNLGVSCGFSDNPPLPGWVMSKMKPSDLPSAFPPPKGRRHWWQKIFKP